MPMLVQYFNQNFSQAYGKILKEFAPEAVEELQNYSWPGNVRELRNTIERVVIMNPGVKVAAGDLPPHGKDRGAGRFLPLSLIQRSDRCVSSRSLSNESSTRLRATSREPRN